MDYTRIIMWNLTPPVIWFYYILLVTMIFVFCYGMWRHWRLWNMGVKERRWGDLIQRGVGSGLNIFMHLRQLREFFPGFIHFMIFWGGMVLLVATTLVAIQHYLGLTIHNGWRYLISAAIYDAGGMVAIGGIIFALFRRFVLRPERLGVRCLDAFLLGLILITLLSGFVVEGLRISFHVNYPQLADAREFTSALIANGFGFERWSFGGWGSSLFFNGLDSEQLRNWHRILWVSHFSMAMFLLAYIPFSRLMHVIAGSLNTFLRNLESTGKLAKLDLENESAEDFGVGMIHEFSKKQLLDLDACTSCGRCQDACPAYVSKKPLSPKKVVQDLKTAMQTTGSALVHSKSKPDMKTLSKPLVDNYIKPDEIWACTTCGSCQEHCPVFIEHVEKIIDMRRYLALTEGHLPHELSQTLRNLEMNGNPWKFGEDEREECCQALGVRHFTKHKDVEWLYWPGCAGAFDSRNQKVTAAIVKLLNAAGVSYAVLGNEEKCCGDSARRLGQEYLYQQLVNENLATFKKHGVKKIITQCPHCFNTFKNEYPQFGGDFEVVHHSEFIALLIAQGKLSFTGKTDLPTAYHDSCYLGRHNGVYNPPRAALEAVADLREVDRERWNGFCCGAGGGRMWLEETIGERISKIRAAEFFAHGVKCIATACPYCLSMLDDAVKSMTEDEKSGVKDLAEILAERLDFES